MSATAAEKLEVGSTLLPAGHSLSLSSVLGSQSQPRVVPSFESLGPSSLLSRLQTFLPRLERANAELSLHIANHGKESVNIENVEGGEEARHIEMNLALAEVDSESSSDDESEKEKKAKGKKGPRIELLGAVNAIGEEGGVEEEGTAAGDSGGSSRKEEEQVPSGKWLTGKELEEQKLEIIKLLRESEKVLEAESEEEEEEEEEGGGGRRPQ